MFLGRSGHTNLCLSKINRKPSKLDVSILALSQTYKVQEPKERLRFGDPQLWTPGLPPNR
jgi:hypothetical protein